MQLKPIDEQIMVLTGASSGMGLVTARMASERGARLVLVARDEDALAKLADELKGRGREAMHVVADVTQEAEVKKVAEQAIEHFGGFDTWVNLVGLTIYGAMDRVAVEDHRRLFETNYWSVFYGSLEAAKHLRQRGGAIINMGSILSDRAVAYQGTYSASKHAIKAFTDVLRMELMHDGAPVSVTLIKPSSMDTPLRHHGKNYLSKEPENPPPAYNPELTAEAILYCAQYPKRDVVVGGGGRLITALAHMAPGVTDFFMAKTMRRVQTTDNPAGPRSRHSLYGPSGDGRERGGTKGALRHSPYTRMQLMRPRSKVAVVAMGVGAGVLGMAILRRQRRPYRPLAKKVMRKIR